MAIRFGLSDFAKRELSHQTITHTYKFLKSKQETEPVIVYLSCNILSAFIRTRHIEVRYDIATKDVH